MKLDKDWFSKRIELLSKETPENVESMYYLKGATDTLKEIHKMFEEGIFE